MVSDVTQILTELQQGEDGAAERLLPAVYQRLHRLAAARIAREPAGQTLQATALVHEAWLRLLDEDAETLPSFDSRAQFYGAAAEAMRRILIDRARERRSQKRGGDRQRVTLDPESLALDDVPVELLDLDEALTQLALEHPGKAQLVSLRFFTGLSLKEAGALLGLSPSTTDRHWAFARAWLYRFLEAEDEQ